MKNLRNGVQVSFESVNKRICEDMVLIPKLEWLAMSIVDLTLSLRRVAVVTQEKQ